MHCADLVKTRDRHQVERLHVDFKPRKEKTSKEKEALLFNCGSDFLDQAEKTNNPVLYHKAIEIFQSMPNYSLCHYNKGLCYLGLHQRESAESSFINAITLNRWEKYGSFKEKCRALIADGILSPQGSKILYQEALQLIANEEYEEAKELLEKISNNAKVEYSLGECCYYLEEEEEALTHFQNLLQENPALWASLSEEEKAEIRNNAHYYIGFIKIDQAAQAEGEQRRELSLCGQEELFECTGLNKVMCEKMAYARTLQNDAAGAKWWTERAVEADLDNAEWQDQTFMRWAARLMLVSELSNTL